MSTVSQKQIRGFTQVLRQLGVLFMRVAGQQSSAHTMYSKQELLALGVLGINVDCRMGEIAEHLGVGQSAVTPIVDRLESQGLVQRRRSDQDRRVWLVELTEKGNSVLVEENKIYQKVATEMLAPLKAAERDTLIKLLKRISDPS